jgi:hypothetical protein
MSPLDHLRPHLWPVYTANWTDKQWDILEALSHETDLGGPAERAVTKMLCAVDGALGRDLARILLDLRKLPANQYAEMIDPEYYAKRRVSHAPDVGVYDAATKELLLAVEGKRYAKINFTASCPHDTEGCNQVICYPRGCWTSSPAAVEGASFLWLHPQDTHPWATGWHEGHLGNREHEQSAGGPDQLRRLVDNQRSAIALWGIATWEDLVTRVQKLPGPAAGAIATIIGTWIHL